jgi:Tol biopolymer transport system component
MPFSHGDIDTNIWRFDTRGEEAPRKWIASTVYDVAAEYSPDGKKIAFASNRSGPLGSGSAMPMAPTRCN